MKSIFQTGCLAELCMSLGLVVAVGTGVGCSQKEQVRVDLPVANQKVPVVLAIAPMDTSALVLENKVVDPQFQDKFLPYLKNTLEQTSVFDKVLLLSNEVEPASLQNFASIRHEAQRLQADLILLTDVVGLNADLPSLVGTMKYLLTTEIRAQLFDTYRGTVVWEKTDRIRAAKDSFYETSEGALETIRGMLEDIVIPSGAAGLLLPMVKHVQSEYRHFAKGVGPKDASSRSNLFEDAHFAKIDAELAPPAVTVTENPDAYALVIGLEHYQRFPQVDYAIRDSALVYEYLHKAMGFPQKNIALLQDNEVTLSQMRARIEKWLPSLVGDNPEAEVFVYYGGHGTTDVHSSKAFLVPFDADLSFLAETAYPIDKLYEGLGQLAAKQVTVVLDSCFSGAGGRSVMLKGARPMLMSLDLPPVQSSNLVVFTASGAKEISSAYEEKSHGLFTYYFFKGMKGEADTDQDGQVSIQEQYHFVSHHVQTAAREMNRDQQPQLLPGLETLQDRGNQVLMRLK